MRVGCGEWAWHGVKASYNGASNGSDMTFLRTWWPGGRRERWLLGLLVGGVVLLPWFLLTEVEDWPGLVDKALARERVPSVEARAKGLLWTAGWVNWAGLLVLLALFPWWSRANSLQPVARPSQWRWSPLTVVAVVGLFGVALVLRLPQMTDSLYNDEAHNYARLFSGSWESAKQEGEKPQFRPARWTETLWRNSGGNNAQPFSLLARASLEGAKTCGLAVEGEVCEWAVTLPSLLAGLATMGLMMGLVGRRWGVVAGLVVLLLLVLHPWHVRHSTIARGQMLMLLGLVMMLVFLEGALREGRWRQWLGYALGMLLCVSSFIGSVYFLAVFNVGLLGMQGLRWRRGEGGSDLLWRPIIGGALAAMAGLALMLPILPELLQILKENPAFRGKMGWRWWQDIGGFLYAGTRWLDHAPDNPVNQALIRWITAPWWWLSLAVFGVCAGVGTGRMWTACGLWRLLAVGTLVGVLLAWGLATIQGNYLNLWYLFFAMPWLVVALALGWQALSGRWPSWLAAVVLVILVAPQSVVAWRFRHLPKQHERAPVELARGARYPHYLATPKGSEALTAGFWCNANLYDPEMATLRSMGELDDLVEKARRERRPLFVAFSHRLLALKSHGDLVKRLEQGDEFELAGRFYGQEEDQFTMHVYRLPVWPGE
jgi:hypothetical protein